MKKVIVIGYANQGNTILQGIIDMVLEKERGIIIIDSKTISKVNQILEGNYTQQMLPYKEELTPIVEQVENPNKKPLREGSKFIPLKKRR